MPETEEGGPWLSPECRDGKHANCDGRALNEDTDEIVECECATCPGRDL